MKRGKVGRIMKLCYMFLYYEKIQSTNRGVKQKVDGQVKAFREAGIDAELLLLNPASRIKKVIPFQTSSCDWMKLKSQLLQFDAIYLRFCFADFQMIKLLKYLKKNNKNLKIVMEIPDALHGAPERTRDAILFPFCS